MNALQEQFKRQKEEIKEKYPAARKGLMRLMIAWLVVRIAMVLVEFSAVLAQQLLLPNLLMNVGLLLVCGAFALCVVNGMKYAALLPLLGGALTTVNSFRDILSIGGLDILTPLQKVCFLSFIIGGILQIVIMAAALIDKRSKPYFDEMQAAQKQFIAQKKQLK